MQERILILGGSFWQIPAIKYAKKSGYYVITCGYFPDNPGHKLADEYHNISIADRSKVLELARKSSVKGIVAYASDLAALTASWVSQQLNLPRNSYKAVQTLVSKDYFRDFLDHMGFNTPKSKGYKSLKDLKTESDIFNFPLIVKPSDRSGSIGVYSANNNEELVAAFKRSFSFSREGKVIVEEFVKSSAPQLHGDAFVLKGEVVFCILGDHIYGTQDLKFTPTGTMIPSKHDDSTLLSVKNELQKLVSSVGYQTGALNVEVIIDEFGRVFFIEVAPRNGGNWVAELETLATGFPLTELIVKGAVNDLSFDLEHQQNGYFSNYVFYSGVGGKFVDVHESMLLEENLLHKHVLISKGSEMLDSSSSLHKIAIYIFQFSSKTEMHEKMSNMHNYLEVITE